MAQQSLQVVNSNDMRSLAYSCAWIIKNMRPEDLHSPLERECVVTMNPGMKMYLQQAIASMNGICTNIAFTQVWSFIWDLHKSLNGADDYNRYSHEHMTWSVFSLLRDIKPDEDWIFSELSDYIRIDEEGKSDMSYQLCGVIADCFDQYQMYRPDWILCWNTFSAKDFDALSLDEDGQLRGSGAVYDFIVKTSGSNENVRKTLTGNIWQMKLWTMLRSNLLKTVNSASLWDRATVVDNLIKKLGEAVSGRRKIPSSKLPKRVFIFGVTALPTQVMALFTALGRLVPVFFMHLNPCQEYWGDLTSVKENWKQEKERIIRYLTLSKLKEKLSAKGLPLPLAKDVGEDSLDEGYLSLFEDADPAAGGAALVDGNPMLLSLGKVGRDTLNVLLGFDEDVNFTSLFFEHEQSSLLNHIKNSLLTLRTDKKRYVIDQDDESLQIRLCHTIVREVEVLRDRMLSVFADDPNLSPGRLLVMVPDIEAYAPYIEAVFGSVPKDDVNYIPYAISDKSGQKSSNVADAMVRLLSIGSGRVTGSLIMELISIDCVGKRFAIEGDDINVILDWLKNSCVHWGLDEQDVKEQLGCDDPLLLPWTLEHGIDRLLEGFTYGPALCDTACESIDSSDFNLLSKLCDFLLALKRLRDTFYPSLDVAKNGFTAEDWIYKISSVLLDGFFVFDEDNEHEREEILSILDEMRNSIANLGNAEDTDADTVLEYRTSLKIRLPVFRAKLIHALGNTHDSTAYLRGSVNFCSLLPMRAVPFEHIFILGLNDSDFPRSDTAPSFNLLGLKALYRRNDRTRVHDDRYIFLEAFLSASKSLYLSYIGQSPVDRSDLNPSAVITELLDYLSTISCVREDAVDDENLSDIKKRLCRLEKLNAYDEDNFRVQGGQGEIKVKPSFNSMVYVDNTDTASSLGRTIPLGCTLSSLEYEVPDEISLGTEDLLSFFISPCRAFLRERLGISLYLKNDSSVADDEPFEVDFLNKGAMTRAVFEKMCENKDGADCVLDAMSKKGELPYGIFGKRTIDDLKDAALRLFNAAGVLENADAFSKKNYHYSFDLDFEGRKVHVNFEGIIAERSNLLINYYAPDEDALIKKGLMLLKALLTAISYHLVDSHSAIPPVYLISKNAQVCKKELKALNDMTDERAKEIIKELTRLYLCARAVPLPLTRGLYDSYFGNLGSRKSIDDAGEFMLSLENTEDLFTYDQSAAYLFLSSSLFASDSTDGMCTVLPQNIFDLTAQILNFIKINTLGE